MYGSSCCYHLSYYPPLTHKHHRGWYLFVVVVIWELRKSTGVRYGGKMHQSANSIRYAHLDLSLTRKRMAARGDWHHHNIPSNLRATQSVAPTVVITRRRPPASHPHSGLHPSNPNHTPIQPHHTHSRSNSKAATPGGIVGW